jgi:hypothetical protein
MKVVPRLRLHSVFAVLSLLAMVSSATAETLSLCDHDRLLRTPCCCPTAETSAEGPVLAQGGCCTVARGTKVVPCPATPPSPDPVPTPRASVTAVVPPAAPAVTLRPAAALERPPDTPSLLSQKTAFLR